MATRPVAEAVRLRSETEFSRIQLRQMVVKRLLVLPILFPSVCSAAPPRVLVEGCHLMQIAREPEIVTPVGMVFDSNGRLLVVESHTHQRPDDYQSPSSDRLRMFSDSDGDGQFGRWSTFAEGFRHAMNVMVRSDGAVYLVTRSDVHLLRDTDKDGTADENERIVRLETTVDYPHNALSGICVDGDKLYLGVGENFGGEYQIIGNDGHSIKNIGGVGTIYSCHLDGSHLQRVAEGFWNPFSLCIAGDHLFCVDNDPDASPPCRLIRVQEKGDFGFRYEFGRAGVHPLQAWNGEFPGTLPMICGTGEAPTAVLFHRGYLWVTSWGDYRIERYQLTPQKDGTYTADRTVVVQGDADFRPTGMAVAPDGSLWFADWVDRSYSVHGKGRIWRLELPQRMEAEFPALIAEPQATWPRDLVELRDRRWEKSTSREELVEILRTALTCTDSQVRLYAVRWIAEERLTELGTDIERLLSSPVTSERYFLAVLAAIDWLSNEPEQRHSGIADGLLARELRNPRRSSEIKTLALNLISPDYKDLTLESLSQYAHNSYQPMQVAAARTTAERTNVDRFPSLVQIASDESLSETVRVEALAGLAAKASEYQELLEELARARSLVTEVTSPHGGALQKEAARILRLSGLTETRLDERPDSGDFEAWFRLLNEPGDAASGRRLFFGSVGPRCGACHRHGGRGGNVGPDLTQINESNSRERVITSILDPSREVAPHYESWVLLTDDGKTHVGQRLPQGGDNGIERYADSAGNVFELKSEAIIHRQAAKTSIMPAGLEKNLTIEDLRDLVTFLME